MKNAEKEKHLDIIQRLVAAEEEEALRIFHGRAFGPRIIALVQAEEKNRRLSSERKVPAAVWTGAALAAIAGIIVLILFIPRPSPIIPVQTIEDILRQAPGARTLQDQTKALLNESEMRPSPFESAILKALGPSAQELPPEALGKGRSTPPSTIPIFPRLGLEKTYEILIEEKSIERVLASLKKTKEV